MQLKFYTRLLAAAQKTTVRNATLTALDQAILSASNFAIGLAFVYKGTPEQYGIFTLFMSVYYLLAAGQNALINTPLMVLSPRLSDDERAAFERGARGLLLVGMIPVWLLVSLGFLLVSGSGVTSPIEYVLIGLCCLPLMLREFVRAEAYTHLTPSVALWRDLVYGFIALAGIGLISAFGRLDAFMVFGMLAIASFIVVIPGISVIRPTRREIAQFFRMSWAHSRWSLLGAASSWLQSNVFVFVPFLIGGSREVAFLAAARMVLMPIMLLSQSWSNYFRPRASQLFALDDTRGATRLFARSSIGIVMLLFTYALASSVALSVVPQHWIPQAYRQITPYILMWAVVTLLQILRTNLSSLLQALIRFKGLGVAAFGVALAVVISSIPLVRIFGGTGSLIATIGGEVVLTASLVWLLVPFFFNKDSDKGRLID